MLRKTTFLNLIEVCQIISGINMFPLNGYYAYAMLSLVARCVQHLAHAPNV